MEGNLNYFVSMAKAQKMKRKKDVHFELKKNFKLRGKKSRLSTNKTKL